MQSEILPPKRDIREADAAQQAHRQRDQAAKPEKVCARMIPHEHPLESSPVRYQTQQQSVYSSSHGQSPDKAMTSL
jgi:hypothetical protein